MASGRLFAQIRSAAIALSAAHEAAGLFDRLGPSIADARVVLLGEATHGTAEFYRLRTAITKELVTRHGFDAIAVEADWPDALRVSRYVRLQGSADRNAMQALEDFKRFPLWMWRNREIVTLIDWLRHVNEGRDLPERVGFYGLDLYSLRSSMDAVISYLDRYDPEAARQARQRYACFDNYGEDPQRYGYATSIRALDDCEAEVVRQLLALQQRSAQTLARGSEADELFYAEQNARVARNAEAYYRAMYRGAMHGERHASWNLRDTHMADTLDALLQHLSERLGRPARVVVWAHNSHIGDARATEMGEQGEINLGQLVRERRGEEQVFLLGFTTHTGSVTAASEWDSPAQCKQVLPSHPDSIERVMHELGVSRVLLPLRGNPVLQHAFAEHWLLERAIGVIYLPQSERASHYFEADVGRQFDALVHLDVTRALHPLDTGAHWQQDDLPDTWPSGI